MATPHVSATAALLIATDFSKDPKEIEKRLEATSEDLGPAGEDDHYGAGLLDAGAALP